MWRWGKEMGIHTKLKNKSFFQKAERSEMKVEVVEGKGKEMSYIYEGEGERGERKNGRSGNRGYL